MYQKLEPREVEGKVMKVYDNRVWIKENIWALLKEVRYYHHPRRESVSAQIVCELFPRSEPTLPVS